MSDDQPCIAAVDLFETCRLSSYFSLKPRHLIVMQGTIPDASPEWESVPYMAYTHHYCGYSALDQLYAVSFPKNEHSGRQSADEARPTVTRQRPKAPSLAFNSCSFM